MSALHADRVMFTLGADVERLKWGMELARKTRRDAGLDPDGIAFGAYVNCGCHRDTGKARDLVRGALTTFARFSVMHGKIAGPVSSGDEAVLNSLRENYDMRAHTRGDSRQAGVLTPDFIERFAVVGTPDRVVAKLRGLAGLGLDKVAIRGSLRGVQPDGGFHLDAQGRLRPDRAVRRRFDQLLSTLGEATIEELGALLQQQARTELGSDDGAAQVMTVWERYLQLQRQLAPAGDTGSAPTADSLALALQERTRQRRLVLGNDWAEAFYGDEEAALQARLSTPPSQAPTGEQAGTALPAAARAPQPGEDLTALQRQREATLGPEAAARLQALDQAQAAWAENIQATRRALTRLQGAAELSALQRQQAIDQLIESRFAPEDRLRARAVLGLINP